MTAATATRPLPTSGVRFLALAPATLNAETRTVEVVWSTGAEGRRQGWEGEWIEALDMSGADLSRLNAGASVLAAHNAYELCGVIGAVVPGTAAVRNGKGTAQIRISDRPDVEPIWGDIQSGILRHLSIGYQVHRWDRDTDPTSGLQRLTAREWTPHEISFVPVGFDPEARVRSAQPATPPTDIPNGDQTMAPATSSTSNAAAVADQQNRQEAREARFEASVRRSAQAAGLTAEETANVLEVSAGDRDKATELMLAAMKRKLEGSHPTRAGHPVLNAQLQGLDPDGGLSPLERAFDDRLAGKRTAPLWLIARDQFQVSGESSAEVFGKILKRGGRTPWLSRGGGFMTTSDLPELLLGSGDRRLQGIFETEASGIYEAVGIESLSDFRARSVLDVGLVGQAMEVKEGGELTYTSISENAGSYAAKRYALGLSMSYEALVNDDLEGLARGIDELGAEMLDKEARELVALFETGADGANTPDGVAIFDASHNNSVAGAAVSITHLGAGVELLRKMQTASGRYIANEPRAVICRPDDELPFRQLTAADYQPSEGTGANGSNPWRNMNVVVEPRLTEAFAYVLGSTTRQPLELGRLTPAPELEEERDFDTRALKARAEHAFGCAAVEHRTVVRLAIS